MRTPLAVAGLLLVSVLSACGGASETQDEKPSAEPSPEATADVEPGEIVGTAAIDLKLEDGYSAKVVLTWHELRDITSNDQIPTCNEEAEWGWERRYFDFDKTAVKAAIIDVTTTDTSPPEFQGETDLNVFLDDNDAGGGMCPDFSTSEAFENFTEHPFTPITAGESKRLVLFWQGVKSPDNPEGSFADVPFVDKPVKDPWNKTFVSLVDPFEEAIDMVETRCKVTKDGALSVKRPCVLAARY
jgi:hypothetical protein